MIDTRKSDGMLAAALVLPAMYILAEASACIASFLIAGVRFGDISSGTWIYEFFLFMDPHDLIRVLVKGIAMSAFGLGIVKAAD